jgi:hypothetical protein
LILSYSQTLIDLDSSSQGQNGVKTENKEDEKEDGADPGDAADIYITT